jgi:hypothetical protein
VTDGVFASGGSIFAKMKDGAFCGVAVELAWSAEEMRDGI